MLPSNPTVFFRHGRTTATLVDPVTPNTQKMTAASSFDSLQEGRVCVVQAQKRDWGEETNTDEDEEEEGRDAAVNDDDDDDDVDVEDDVEDDPVEEPPAGSPPLFPLKVRRKKLRPPHALRLESLLPLIVAGWRRAARQSTLIVGALSSDQRYLFDIYLQNKSRKIRHHPSQKTAKNNPLANRKNRIRAQTLPPDDEFRAPGGQGQAGKLAS